MVCDGCGRIFPLSLRLIREIHAILLSTGRGQDKEPGEFRRTQNWIGGTRPGNALFVPPPPHLVQECLGALEVFIHSDSPDLPLLVKAALVHVQFETIHPFLDGNGRLGRLLITFLMCERGVLREPLLYLSLFFKQNRQIYYEHLQAVRERGEWEAWVDFFLRGVIETARQGIQTAQNLLRLFGNDGGRIEQLGRPAATALRLHQLLQRRGLTTIPACVPASGLVAADRHQCHRPSAETGDCTRNDRAAARQGFCLWRLSGYAERRYRSAAAMSLGGVRGFPTYPMVWPRLTGNRPCGEPKPALS